MLYERNRQCECPRFCFFVQFLWDLNQALENILSVRESVLVNHVIDGDTIKSNQTSIRLLGINSPEKGELYHLEAKEFLENEILNKTVLLEYGKERTDQYKRTLAYVYFENKNINLELVEKGFANYYFPSGKDYYYSDFEKAWEKCIEKNINLCEKSEHICAGCIFLEEFFEGL